MSIIALNVILSVVTKNVRQKLFLQKTNNMIHIHISEEPQQPKHEHSFFRYEDETIFTPEDMVTHKEVITHRLKSIICLCGEVLEVTPQAKRDRVVENNITYTKLN